MFELSRCFCVSICGDSFQALAHKARLQIRQPLAEAVKRWNGDKAVFIKNKKKERKKEEKVGRCERM